MIKNKLIETLTKLRFKLDRLSQRDRVVVLFLTVLGVVFLWYFLAYAPQTNALKKTTDAINSEKTQTTQLIQKRTLIESLVKDNTMAKLVTKYNALQLQMNELENKVTRYQERFIDDKDLATVLQTILRKTSGVTIIKFSDINIPSEIRSPPPPTAATNNPATVAPATTPPLMPNAEPKIDRVQYRLTLTGDYFAIMDYFKKLEQTKWQLYWDTFDYTVKTYPIGIATIEFYTLRPAATAATFTGTPSGDGV